MAHQVINNTEKNQYEMHIPPYTALIAYTMRSNEIVLYHTEVPEALEGQGIGSELVLQALEDIEKTGYRLIPLCPFVAAYIKRHPEWRRLVLRD